LAGRAARNLRRRFIVPQRGRQLISTARFWLRRSV
jgi:hypothetical protein